MSATPTVACALRRHFIFFVARSCRLARREASCGCDGTLHSGWRKESSQNWRNESRISDDRRRFWAVTVPSIYDGQRKHHPCADRTFAIACRVPRGWQSKTKSRLIARYQTSSAPSLVPRHTRLLVTLRLKLTGYFVNEWYPSIRYNRFSPIFFITCEI